MKNVELIKMYENLPFSVCKCNHYGTSENVKASLTMERGYSGLHNADHKQMIWCLQGILEVHESHGREH